MSIQILTHRGLEPSNGSFPWSESTREAFTDQLRRGFGLEFDLAITGDRELIVLHDRTLSRLTHGSSHQAVADLSWNELQSIVRAVSRANARGVSPSNEQTPPAGSLLSMRDLLTLLRNTGETSGTRRYHALHFKGYLQTDEHIVELAGMLREFSDLIPQLLVFDLTPRTAELLKDALPALSCAASVSDPHDIERFNAAVGGTLMTLEVLLSYRSLFSWAWLDEWDRTGANGTEKKLYSPETIDRLRQNNYRVAILSPELHATSPGLYGSEHHPDGQSIFTVEKRAAELIAVEPDLICTDYPEQYRAWCDR